ncbi:MAG: DUF5068 domain-containing protein [Enterococcus sp.]
MKKTRLALLIVPLLLLSGCNSTQQISDEPRESTKASSTKKLEESSEESSEEEESSEDSSEISETSDSTKDSAKKSSSDISWADVESDLEEKTETSSLDLLYENSEPMIYTENDVEVQVNGYRYYKIQNFTRNLRIPFGDQNAEGGVIVLAVTLKNETDKTVYYGNGFSFSITGSRSSLMRTKNMLTDDMEGDLIQNDSEIATGEELVGFIPFAVEPAEMEKLDENNEAILEVPGIFTKKGSFKSADALFMGTKETVPFDAKGEAKSEVNTEAKTEDKSEATSALYEDKATAENMGTKRLLVNKKVDETHEFEGVKVTLDGYQLTEFEPNEDQAARFRRYDTGIVLLTAKVTVQNNGKEVLQFNDTSGSLKIGNKGSIISQSALEVRADPSELPIGDTKTKYVVVPIDKESYEKLYKGKEFVLNINIHDESHSRMNSAGDIEFRFEN